jgi:ABC-type phosphate/phosphonate transport system substrate-binding protein
MTGAQRRIAALPMYDFPELARTHDALWSALARHLAAAGVADCPGALSHDLDARAVWGHPDLLLGQGCDYPLAKSFADRVRVVATPRYGVPGCEGARCRSAIVVRVEDAAAILEDLRGYRCVINERDSNSGMNLLRAALAPVAHGAPFFSAVTVSGAHRRSAEFVAAGRADVAALDCVSFAHLQRLYPDTTGRLRVLAWTPASPSLPLITARATGADTVMSLKQCLAAVAADERLTPVRAGLFLEGFDLEPEPPFARVLQLEAAAEQLGYPTLA